MLTPLIMSDTISATNFGGGMDDVFDEVCIDAGGTSYCFASEEDAQEFMRCVPRCDARHDSHR